MGNKTASKIVALEKALIAKYGADAFETDCRPDRRDDHGIETPRHIQEEIDRRKAAREKKSDS